MYADYQEKGYCFSVIDLGAGTSGWNFFIMEKYPIYETLILDAKETQNSSSHFINRHFDIALDRWGREWMESATGAMPQMQVYSDGEMCEDNIPEVNF